MSVGSDLLNKLYALISVSYPTVATIKQRLLTGVPVFSIEVFTLFVGAKLYLLHHFHYTSNCLISSTVHRSFFFNICLPHRLTDWQDINNSPPKVLIHGRKGKQNSRVSPSRCNTPRHGTGRSSLRSPNAINASCESCELSVLKGEQLQVKHLINYEPKSTGTRRRQTKNNTGRKT